MGSLLLLTAQQQMFFHLLILIFSNNQPWDNWSHLAQLPPEPQKASNDSTLMRRICAAPLWQRSPSTEASLAVFYRKSVMADVLQGSLEGCACRIQIAGVKIFWIKLTKLNVRAHPQWLQTLDCRHFSVQQQISGNEAVISGGFTTFTDTEEKTRGSLKLTLALHCETPLWPGSRWLWPPACQRRRWTLCCSRPCSSPPPRHLAASGPRCTCEGEEEGWRGSRRQGRGRMFFKKRTEIWARAKLKCLNHREYL